MNRGTLFDCICLMNKRQGTKHKVHLNNVWLLSTGRRRGEQNSVVVQANIYLGKNRWAQNLPSNKWKSDVTKCKCAKCCSVPKYILWDDISFQYNFSHSSQWTIFLPLCHSDHCPLGRQWKSSELLHSTPSAILPPNTIIIILYCHYFNFYQWKSSELLHSTPSTSLTLT